ncbi:hypothetical protein [Janthinobacterium agaricidamnosum]|uniref:DUF2116 family Zn-ribbon domain-containing protein n=1 Tax=Janthinobacterium agaricidamnosum NBRC 102515 = DSM 9628 TaxID=1349767 RepID=W0V0N9_9BURK|nr:hypothetical protein [Janthinobacterium agaricidamnosum]CDG80903.1 hypothetical protein GJA_240 [Janthinobacterium agaricidamnosum NBRC 102515 = DSM 9628]
METTHDSLPDADGIETQAQTAGRPARQMLPPKGACWYCDKPLDSVRRFCGKECADAYTEEVAYSR